MSYKIVRFYQRSDKRTQVVKGGLSLQEAQDHCRDPETSSKTCSKRSSIARTNSCGPWFEGYEQE